MIHKLVAGMIGLTGFFMSGTPALADGRMHPCKPCWIEPWLCKLPPCPPKQPVTQPKHAAEDADSRGPCCWTPHGRP